MRTCCTRGPCRRTAGMSDATCSLSFSDVYCVPWMEKIEGEADLNARTMDASFPAAAFGSGDATMSLTTARPSSACPVTETDPCRQ